MVGGMQNGIARTQDIPSEPTIVSKSSSRRNFARVSGRVQKCNDLDVSEERWGRTTTCILFLTNHPLKQIMAKSDASGRLVKWAVELGEFDIEFQTRTAVKAQVLADFIVELREPPKHEGGWLLHVDGSSNTNNGGVGIFLQGPGEVEIEIAIKLSFPSTNHEAEYEALIQGLQIAWDGGVKELDVYTDSQLVEMQVEGLYETREWSMVQYLKKVRKMIVKFDKYQIHQIPREENEQGDALSKFGATIAGVKESKVVVLVKEVPTIEETINVVEEHRSWKPPFIQYLKDGSLPSDLVAAKRLQFKANRFTLLGGELYKRTSEGLLLKCLSEDRARYVLSEINEGILQKMRKLPKVREPVTHATDPIRSDKISCPFDQWGIDIVGPFPLAAVHKKFMIVKPTGKQPNGSHKPNSIATLENKVTRREGIVGRRTTGGIMGIPNDPGIGNRRDAVVFGVWKQGNHTD
ncbi:UNVERIFIED_CONTAM: Ribonuclease HI [Sesamum latifolium]|uniref:Ribonuclease HI n=1 Tax=Sesamum latifolium TaxID=2727402 RepID=A0AAW2VEB7_9LAMI